ncbi:hypothetical protein [Pedobacter sp. MW01-1-1]|uniref:hypothetical protein n=1 Tax=Pedobacter sp. MW01-1-1 TaxID=3383027 RepID=UPI003FEE9AA8
MENIINTIHPNYDFLSEQTIFAHIASKSLGVLWKNNVVANFGGDNLTLKPMKINGLIGRHYTQAIFDIFFGVMPFLTYKNFSKR